MIGTVMRAAAAGSSGALPTFVAGSTGDVNTLTPVAPVPSGVMAGDLMLIALAGTPPVSMTPPAGWSLLASNTSTAQKMWIYYRVASGSEPASYNWTATGGAVRDITVAYRGASGIDVNAIAVGTSSTPTTPTVTTTAGSCRLIAFIRTGAAAVWTPPASMTVRQTSGTTPNGAWDEPLAAAGATGSRTFDSGGSGDWVAASVAIKP